MRRERMSMPGSPVMEALEARWLASATPKLENIGILGDSYSDEYQFSPGLGGARNWVEQLAANKLVNSGTETTTSRGAPRNAGYTNDWATYGATTADLPGQVAGLTAQAAAGQIDDAVIFIGGNDFLNTLQSVASNPSAAPTAIAGTERNVSSAIEAAISKILASSPAVKVVVATLPPVSDLPVVNSLANTAQLRSLVQLADSAEVQVNTALKAFTKAHARTAIADFAAAVNSLSNSPTFNVGNVTINATASGSDPHDLFLSDGLHLGTVGQGLLANIFVNAIDTSFGQKITPLSNDQILKDAGLE